MPSGKLAFATMPNQLVMPKLGKPDSAMVGMPGELRWPEETAKALTRPDLMNWPQNPAKRLGTAHDRLAMHS